MGDEEFNRSGASLGVTYLDNGAGTTLDGSATALAASTSVEYASAVVGAGSSVSFAAPFIAKSATAFNLDIHGIVFRPSLAFAKKTDDGTVTVADDGASWTTIAVGSFETNRFDDLLTPVGAIGHPGCTGLFHAHACIKCEDLLAGSELAIRLQYNNPASAAGLPLQRSYEGNRIVAPLSNRPMQIVASALEYIGAGGYVLVQAQHVSASGGASAVNVELVHAYVVDGMPWQ